MFVFYRCRPHQNRPPAHNLLHSRPQPDADGQQGKTQMSADGSFWRETELPPHGADRRERSGWRRWRGRQRNLHTLTYSCRYIYTWTHCAYTYLEVLNTTESSWYCRFMHLLLCLYTYIYVFSQNEVTSLRTEVTQLKQILLAHKDCPVSVRQRETQSKYESFSHFLLPTHTYPCICLNFIKTYETTCLNHISPQNNNNYILLKINAILGHYDFLHFNNYFQRKE